MVCPNCGDSNDEGKRIAVRLHGGVTRIQRYYKCGYTTDEANTNSNNPNSGIAIRGSGPIWGQGYRFMNIYWGQWWVQRHDLVVKINTALEHIEADNTYSGGLSEYDVGKGAFFGSFTIAKDPPNQLDGWGLEEWLNNSVSTKFLPNLNGLGAYIIFLPPDVTFKLGGKTMGTDFHGYHTWNGDRQRPIYYAVEQYPDSSGDMSPNIFDTVTLGLSAEMVGLETDMQPGDGWIISGDTGMGGVLHEICGKCDTPSDTGKPSRLNTGELVAPWWSNAKNKCWEPTPQQQTVVATQSPAVPAPQPRIPIVQPPARREPQAVTSHTDAARFLAEAIVAVTKGETDEVINSVARALASTFNIDEAMVRKLLKCVVSP
ncbi:MAG: hypothetical protein QXP58_09635 [Thermoprotei archaeon]